VKRIRHKLHVGNKAELTRRAIELGYVKTPP
jgi:DNA-binding CsgD family transcriptional regulator